MNASISAMKASRFVCKHRPVAQYVLRTYQAGMSDGKPFYVQVTRCRDCGKHQSQRIEV